MSQAEDIRNVIDKAEAGKKLDGFTNRQKVLLGLVAIAIPLLLGAAVEMKLALNAGRTPLVENIFTQANALCTLGSDEVHRFLDTHPVWVTLLGTLMAVIGNAVAVLRGGKAYWAMFGQPTKWVGGALVGATLVPYTARKVGKWKRDRYNRAERERLEVERMEERERRESLPSPLQLAMVHDIESAPDDKVDHDSVKGEANTYTLIKACGVVTVKMYDGFTNPEIHHTFTDKEREAVYCATYNRIQEKKEEAAIALRAKVLAKAEELKAKADAVALGAEAGKSLPSTKDCEVTWSHKGTPPDGSAPKDVSGGKVIMEGKVPDYAAAGISFNPTAPAKAEHSSLGSPVGEHPCPCPTCLTLRGTPLPEVATGDRDIDQGPCVAGSKYQEGWWIKVGGKFYRRTGSQWELNVPKSGGGGLVGVASCSPPKAATQQPERADAAELGDKAGPVIGEVGKLRKYLPGRAIAASGGCTGTDGNGEKYVVGRKYVYDSVTCNWYPHESERDSVNAGNAV